MSKAFDRLNHVQLMLNLHSIGFHGAVLQWYRSYLSNRRQQVSVHGSLSDSTTCNRGVPHGSVLGPLLFCLYIRSVPGIFKSGSLSQLYADEITVYTSSKSVDELCEILPSDLRNLHECLCERFLLLNPQKTRNSPLQYATPDRPYPAPPRFIRI